MKSKLNNLKKELAKTGQNLIKKVQNRMIVKENE